MAAIDLEVVAGVGDHDEVVADDVQRFEQHRLNHERVVVVPVKFGAVAIQPVADIPFAVFCHALEQSGVVALFAGTVQEHFHGRRKKFPVVFAGPDPAR